MSEGFFCRLIFSSSKNYDCFTKRAFGRVFVCCWGGWKTSEPVLWVILIIQSLGL